MRVQHTPGPWRIDDEHDLDRVEIVGRPDYACTRFGEQGEWRVAEIDDLMGEKPDVVAANARLIAAAPDLYAALVAVAKLRGTLAGYQLDAQVDAALAKVTAA